LMTRLAIGVLSCPPPDHCGRQALNSRRAGRKNSSLVHGFHDSAEQPQLLVLISAIDDHVINLI
jgi:hypothetical protein